MTATFVTAIGTDIGKTFVVRGLVRHLRAAGWPVEAIKPVATGYDPAKKAASDPGLLLSALGRPLTDHAIERIAPWRYAAPLSPDMAARRESRPIEFDRLVEFCRGAIAMHKRTLLIEGIGGVMVPLDDERTVLDWMAALDIPVLLVTGTYLGSLSHTLTALAALRQRKLAVAGIVVNESPDSSVPLADTVETLSNFVGSLVVLPRLPGDIADHPAFGKLATVI